MVIKIGNKRIKLLNWIIFILFVILIIYIIGELIFMLPIFKKEASFILEKENYKIDEKIYFKHAWLKCDVKEEYYVEADKKISKKLENDLIKDGFLKKKDKYIRKYKEFGICSDNYKKYKKEHKKNNVIFKLNGKKEERIYYPNGYDDPYVTYKLNNKNNKNVEVDTDFNKNKTGTYTITYSISISKYYKQRLYRTISVEDNTKPVINLTGEKNYSIDYGSRYEELGYSASDDYDGDITNKVVIKNKINTKKPGIYIIEYKVTDSSGNSALEERKITVNEKTENASVYEPKIEVKNGITYVNGILIVNKNYALPKNYDPKVNQEALSALKKMQADASVIGLNLPLVSGYRSYSTQQSLYNKYVKKDGEEVASTYSAKPGHSEHQTGLAFDIGSVDRSFANTNEAKWIEENAHLYGFIVRYPKDKTNITGYIYEPWHVRYLGVDVATKVKKSGLTLEEYLGIN